LATHRQTHGQHRCTKLLSFTSGGLKSCGTLSYSALQRLVLHSSAE